MKILFNLVKIKYFLYFERCKKSKYYSIILDEITDK